jgi:hypothetical protein
MFQSGFRLELVAKARRFYDRRAISLQFACARSALKMASHWQTAFFIRSPESA